MSAPIKGSYWVLPNTFAAGRIPFSNEALYKSEAQVLADLGIYTIISLLDESYNYSKQYEASLKSAGFIAERYRHFSLQDFSVPSRKQCEQILIAIDEALDQKHSVYLHCNAGQGRTGLIVACWLLQHSLADEQTVFKILQDMRCKGLSINPDSQSPETTAQLEFVRDYAQLVRAPTL